MAASSLSSKASHHVRSNSVPSEAHPLVSQVDEHLCKIKDASSKNLNDLQHLFDYIDQMLSLPLAQRSLAQEISHSQKELLMEGSLRLLDVCDGLKDAFIQTKEFTHQLKSVLRRKIVSENEFESEIRKCLKSMKSIKKTIDRVLKVMESKQIERNNENGVMVILSLIKEAEAVTFEVVKSLSSFITGSNSKFPSKKQSVSNWFLISKMVRSKRSVVVDREEANRNELFHVIDDSLHSIRSTSNKSSDFSTRIQNLQNFLGKFELRIQDVEEELDSLYRSLIKTRVSLLNIFNN